MLLLCWLASTPCAGLTTAAYGTRTGASSGSNSLTFLCEDKSTLTVEFITGARPQARVTYGSSRWTLPQVPSASGAHYATSTISVWNKGNEVRFERGSQSLTCTAARPAR